MMHLNAILRALLVLLFFKPHEYALYAQNNMNFSWRKNTFVAQGTKLVTPIFCKVIPGGDLSLEIFPPRYPFVAAFTTSVLNYRKSLLT